MWTGSSSLLRPSSAPLVRVAVLGILALAVAPPVATAASHAPDPSPVTGLVRPDPYPAARAPAKPTTPIRVTTVPAQQRLPVHVQRVAPPRHAPKAATPRHKPPKTVARSTNSGPELVALAYSAIASPRHVSRTLVLVLGLLVLLSASLVAGAARELAR
jgi:hypothetical protein